MILDMCCGTRSWWFQKRHPLAIYGDMRHEVLELAGNGWKCTLRIQPDVRLDFRSLPFRDETFSAVVFDPPHIVRTGGKRGFIRHRYGELTLDWKRDLAAGFAEALRVLKPFGCLFFKWAETRHRVSRHLATGGDYAIGRPTPTRRT